MKISTVKHIIKDGIENVYKNKAMTIASIAIVAATIVLFGIFLIMIMNINNNVKDLKQRPMIEVFCNENLDDSQLKEIEQNIKDNGLVKNYVMISKAEAFEIAKELLGEEKGVLEGIDEDFLPVSFRINLINNDKSEEFIEQMGEINGIDKINFSKVELDFVNKISYWIKFISFVVITIFSLAAVGIISNTIKLTVVARKREIDIMKYVGASDVFVRGPFIIEGIFIGFIGAVVAFTIVGHGYILMSKNIIKTLDMVKIISFKNIINCVLLLFCMAGSAVGAIGGIFSVQKYLKEI